MHRIAPLVVLAALAVGCASSQPAPAAPATTSTGRPAASTAPPRPGWCSLYDGWKQAGDTMASIERQHGSKVTTWPDDAYTRWERALTAQMNNADRLWGRTDVPKGWDARARACR
ncbi:MAG: hypothetical protein F4110_08515 [Acidimicrobiaceae bacterium]|nr:hypothetical protein [Acidimicrobiaceae bacterium]MXZ98687.1 hypothetical protein [Acidimicrobiaceae bacterium]MYE75036.1 hypothetical protein [Acidimicrobiaceae bacterium]MYE98134.1 hypothetical protein [Acidimicrobiaceae bacterium]MYH43219.1 hypothetical protein [Acidimicrobiaceae bacterium]